MRIPPPKILYLIRGLPGSGKSTLGEILAPGQCVSADDFAEDAEGRYCFDPDKLSYYHKECEKSCRYWMEGFRRTRPHALNPSEPSVIAVANTFSQPWEAEPYFEMADEYGYEVFVIECQNDFGSIHNVPQKTIDAMRSRWLPLL